VTGPTGFDAEGFGGAAAAGDDACVEGESASAEVGAGLARDGDEAPSASTDTLAGVGD
jgi:hypothetical protein